MKKFEYCQIDYFNYPSEEELNKMGEIGWELVCIGASEKRTFYDEKERSYTREIHKATFKREKL